MAAVTTPLPLKELSSEEQLAINVQSPSSDKLSSGAFKSNSTADWSTASEHGDDESEDDVVTTPTDTFENSDADGAADGPAARELREVLLSEEAIAKRLESVGQPGLVGALARIVTHLASLGNRPQKATIFHATRPPPISVGDYLERLAKYYACSDACFVLALIYIDRLVKLHPGFVVSNFNIHRLLAVSLMLAAKFHDDVYYANAHYGKVAGLHVQELNKLEERFLQLLKWRMAVLPSEYDAYLGHLMLSVGVQC